MLLGDVGIAEILCNHAVMARSASSRHTDTTTEADKGLDLTQLPPTHLQQTTLTNIMDRQPNTTPGRTGTPSSNQTKQQQQQQQRRQLSVIVAAAQSLYSSIKAQHNPKTTTTTMQWGLRTAQQEALKLLGAANTQFSTGLLVGLNSVSGRPYACNGCAKKASSCHKCKCCANTPMTLKAHL